MEYGDDYTVANRQITFDTAPTGELIIYRETPTDRLVQFVEGSVLKATDMNISTLQQLHIIEESQDWTTSNSVVFNDETGCWEGKGYRIANLADPVNAQDAVTKKYIEDTTTGYLSEMNNTKNSCISALNETKTTFENFVNTKTSEVNSLKTQAETAVTNAEGYAELAQKWAESSESPDGAEGSKSSKTWAAEAANSAASAAQYAQEAANTAAGLGNPVMSVEENNGVVTVTKSDNTTNTFNTFTLDMVYPVGSIYLSTNATNPGTLFGGTWEAFAQGRVLIGAGTGTDSRNESKEFTAGETGGEYNHQLTTNEMPSHTHTASTDSTGAHTHTGTAASAGAHTHTVSAKGSSSDGSGAIINRGSDGGGSATNFATSSSGAHTHSVTINSAGAHSHTVTVNSTGGNAAHNLMQPWIGVYMWKRTA